MLPESLGYFVCLAVLWLLGLGPGLLAVGPGPRRLAHAAAIAPAVGWGLVGLLGFPLARYVAPVQVWAWPATLLGLAASLGLVAADWRRCPRDYAVVNRRWWAAAIVLLLANMVLVSPLVLRGLQYAIYRANPSDAFLYMSLAETLRAVDWTTVVRGSELTAANWPAVADLARLSPTALFAARQVGAALALNNMASLAWLTELAGSQLPRFYYARHLLACAAALPLAWALGDRLGLGRWLNTLSALAIALGFWSRFVLETDSGYEISALPMVLLLGYAWVQVEAEPPAWLSPARLLFAFAAAAIVALYAPVGLVIALAHALYYGAGLLQRTVSARALLRHAALPLLVLLLLAATGQLDYLGRNVVTLIGRAANEALFAAPATELLKADGLAGLWGLPGSVLWGGRPRQLRLPLDQLAAALGVLLTLLMALGVWQARRAHTPRSHRVVLALAGAGLLLAAVLFAAGNDRAAGKSVTYVYPFLMLSVAQSVPALAVFFSTRAQAVLPGLVAVWLASQVALGVWLPLRVRSDFLGQPAKLEHYDVSAITRELDRRRPRLLLVDIPSGDTWMFAYYSQFVFGRYPAHFQRGLVIDNNVSYQRLWVDTLPGLPDYAVVLKAADYIGPQQLGTWLAETPDLVLYQLTTRDLALLRAREAEYQQLNASLVLFPSLAE